MTLSIKNGGYAFLIRLDLMLSMSLWKEFQLLQILNDVVCLECEIIDTWNEDIKKSDGMVNLFSIVNLMLGCLLFKKFKIQKQLECHQHILNKSWVC